MAKRKNFFQRLFSKASEDERQLNQYLRESHRSASTRLDRGLEAWELMKKMARPNMRTIDAFEEAYPNLSLSIYDWAYEMMLELHNAGLENPVYHQHRLSFTSELLAQFTDEDDNWKLNFMRGRAEALWKLGQRVQSEAAYADLLEQLPDEGWGYIGWASEYWMWPGSPGEYAKAEAILLRALERPNLIDRVDVLDRLCDLYNEWGKSDKLAETEERLAQEMAKSRSR